MSRGTCALTITFDSIVVVAMRESYTTHKSNRRLAYSLGVALFYATASRLEVLARQLEVPADELREWIQLLVSERKQAELKARLAKVTEEPEHANS